LGEDHLSDICRSYPRWARLYNGRIERSLAVSCPEAARLVLFSEGPLCFEESEVDSEQSEQGRIGENNSSGHKKAIDLRHYKHNSDGIAPYPAKIKGFIIIFSLSQVVDLSIKFTEWDEYRSLGEKIMWGLGFDRNLQTLFVTDRVIDKYFDSYRRYYLEFIGRHPYMEENLLVNYSFSHFFDAKPPVFVQYCRMLLYYALIRLMLIGLSADYGRLDERLAISLISLSSRSLIHNRVILDTKLARLRERGNLNMSYFGNIIFPGGIHNAQRRRCV
jgi:lysine-N-methylase